MSDTEFSSDVSTRTFRDGERPVVYVDEAHYNYHTIEGRHATFADVQRNDGFVVSPLRQTFSAESLEDVTILVIANAVAAENANDEADWLPVHSAFTDSEIAALEQWVSSGGSLFLIADHCAPSAIVGPIGVFE